MLSKSFPLSPEAKLGTGTHSVFSQKGNSLLSSMPSIHVMSDALASQVAAGEVVERPASVLKELIENSIDAGAKTISVDISRGGIALLKVTDDGCGMNREDALLCIQRHATSKIQKLADLLEITQLGFRGEALPSIAGVSHFQLSTREQGEVEGTEILVEGGELKNIRSSGVAHGTSIEIRELFYNIPARRKFLKSEETEAAQAEHQIRLHALAFPEIRFILRRDSRPIYDRTSTNDWRVRIAQFTSAELAEKLIPIPETLGPGICISGFLLPVSEARRSRKQQFIFLNRRPIEDPLIARAIRDGYSGFPTGLHPALYLNIEIEPALVDVNVHPSKREVRFSRPNDVVSTIMRAVSQAFAAEIRPASGIFSPPAPEKKEAQTPPASQPPRTQLTAKQTTAAPSPRAESSPVKQENTPLYKNSAPVAPPKKKEQRPAPVAETLSQETSQKNIPAQKPPILTRPVPVKITPVPPLAGHTPHLPLDHSPSTTSGTSSPCAESPQQTQQSTSPLPQKPTPALITPTTAQATPPIPAPTQAPKRASFRFLGDLHGKYFLWEGPEGLVLMNPVSARERILFEQFRVSHKGDPVPTQRLLVPIMLELDIRDFGVLNQLRTLFDDAGFVLQPFGRTTFQIESIPAFLNPEEARAFLLDLVDKLSDNLFARKVKTLTYEAFASELATRIARKGHVTPAEAPRLMEDLLSCDLPYCTPGNKPTLIPLSLQELNRKFGSL